MFKPISGHENLEVSDTGIIRRISDGFVYKQYINSTGYSAVQFKTKGKQNHLLVHRAVALAFIENPDSKPCVNHIDGNKQNNSIKNLEWCTHEENTKHAALTLGVLKQYREYNKKKEKAVIGTYMCDPLIEKRYKSVSAAAKDRGVSKSCIISALKGRTETSGGMYWRYSE